MKTSTMGKEDFTKVTTESILLEELGSERAGSVHTTWDHGNKKDTGKKEEAPPAKLWNFFVSLRTWNGPGIIKLIDHSAFSNSGRNWTG